MRTTPPTSPNRRSRARHRAALAALVGALAASLSPAKPAAAHPAIAPVLAQPPAPVDPATDTSLANISLDLALVSVDGPRYRVASKAVQGTLDDLDATRKARAIAEVQLATLGARDIDLTAHIAQDTVARKKAAALLARVRDTLRALAVTSYVRGTGPQPDPLDLEAANSANEQQVVFSTVGAGQRDKENAATTALVQADAALNADLVSRTQIRQEIVQVTGARDEAAVKEGSLGSQLSQQSIELEQARARAYVSNGDDMSLLALDAYWKAAQSMAKTRPRCGITWWALAGIGRVEGRHGTYGGSVLLGTGETSKPIIGIPLDGTADTALIPDTDNGELDGDPNYDHAVGPMQFIPSTWRRWGVDADDDGNVDPHNMYDATLTAARYLCASGPMVTEDDMTRGYLSYNHSDAYAAEVLAYAEYYRDNISIPPVPSHP